MLKIGDKVTCNAYSERFDLSRYGIGDEKNGGYNGEVGVILKESPHFSNLFHVAFDSLSETFRYKNEAKAQDGKWVILLWDEEMEIVNDF